MHRQGTILAPLLVALLLAPPSFGGTMPPPKAEAVGPPLFAVTVKGRTGFIDPAGKIVIEPVFEKAITFSEGLAAFAKNGKWGFIDTAGKVVIEPRFSVVGRFSDGLATFKAEGHAGRTGYIDKTGAVVIQPQFEWAEDFRNGLARIGWLDAKNRLLSIITDGGAEYTYGFIDRAGKRVPDPAPTHFASGEPDELIPFTRKGLVGYMNAKGEIMIKPQFAYAASFSQGLALAHKDRLYGYIDKRGEWVIPPRFEYAGNFHEGLAGVKLGAEGWGIIDREGKEVIPATFGWVYAGFRHGLAEVMVDGKAGYINPKGEWVWKPSE